MSSQSCSCTRFQIKNTHMNLPIEINHFSKKNFSSTYYFVNHFKYHFKLIPFIFKTTLRKFLCKFMQI